MFFLNFVYNLTSHVPVTTQCLFYLYNIVLLSIPCAASRLHGYEESTNFCAVYNKQGGVISPVLFCIYIDGLLQLLSKSKVGCFTRAHTIP